MAVLASAQCTLSVAVDVQRVDAWYRLQASTAAPPSKPDEASPSGWDTTEPDYDGTATNTLYTCQRTTLTDGTFYWSDVCVSSSYEAAKQAKNAADAAQATANATAAMVRQYGDGVLVCRPGQTVGALVNADGSFDAVSVTWSDGVPTAGGALASFGTDGATVGASGGNQVVIDSDSVDIVQDGSVRASFGDTAKIGYPPSQYDLWHGVTISPSNISLDTEHVGQQTRTLSQMEIGSRGLLAYMQEYLLGGNVETPSGTSSFQISPSAFNLIFGGASTANIQNFTCDRDAIKVNGVNVVRSVNGKSANAGGEVTLPNASSSSAGLMSVVLYNLLSQTATTVQAMDNYIVETGGNSDTSAAMQWRWLKFDNGYAIAWGYRTLSQKAETAWGSMYYTAIAAQNAPFTWSTVPYEWATIDSNGYYFCLNNANPTTTKTGTYYAVCPTKQTTARSVQFTVLEIGRWK